MRVMKENPGMSEGDAGELAAAMAVCDDMVARPSLLGDAGMCAYKSFNETDTSTRTFLKPATVKQFLVLR